MIPGVYFWPLVDASKSLLRSTFAEGRGWPIFVFAQKEGMAFFLAVQSDENCIAGQPPPVVLRAQTGEKNEQDKQLLPVHIRWNSEQTRMYDLHLGFPQGQWLVLSKS